MRLMFWFCVGLQIFWTFTAAAAEGGTTRIAGTVEEIRSGTPDVTVILCDQATGLPVAPDSFRPFNESKLKFPVKVVTTQTDRRGNFVFTNVPPGEYRVVAQKWTGPFKGIFEVHGTVIQLFGTADHIRVPSDGAEKVWLRPGGDGVVTFDLETSNDGNLMVVSAQPLLADPILGFHAPGSNFLSHAIAVNVMPSGRTTMVGVPPGTFHAWFFANDNSPGFAAETFVMDKAFVRVPKIPFVAGWSDGRHDPPARLKELSNRLSMVNLTARGLLGIDENLSIQQQFAKAQGFLGELARVVSLPDGEATTVGDLVAIIGYENLKAGRRGK
jgi:hypothetical protein